MDLWVDLDQLLGRRPCGSVRMKKIKGHSTWQDVGMGRVQPEDKRGNDHADALAVAGAALHAVRPRDRQKIVARRLLALELHRMMVEI
eukprot:8007831-Karenia_brevis.AAC.1